jgi:RNA 2',3'-cyclic 3'-phosphodiesterase
MPSGSTSPRAESPTARLFVALWPEAQARAQLAACRDDWHLPAAARPVASENLHATLHFIGNVARDRIAPLRHSLAAVPIERLTVRPEAMRLWPGGIAVLILQAEPRLRALHERIGAALLEVGATLDARPFVPHVTLARKAGRAVAPVAPLALAWCANGFALVQSPGGGRSYCVMERWGP